MKKVLLIEDEKLIREMLTTYLKGCGYECYCVYHENLADIIIDLKRGYDIVFCDYMMPNFTAFDIFQAMDENLRRKFVILTGGQLDYDKENFFERKGIKIIYKPFELSLISQTIKELLESK